VRKTLFAGLTVLEADESVTEDGAAFIGRDRDAIDYFLELGAKTHRHDARPGLLDPEQAMGGSALPSGGSIPADQAYALGYTLEDDSNGETLLSPITLVATPQPLDSPLAAASGSVDYDNGGELVVDTYYYAFSFIDGEGGETPVGPATPVEREPGFANARITLGGMGVLADSAGAVGWRLYRAVGGGDFGYLASGIAAENTYHDQGSANVNCDITPLPDDVNTTNGDNTLEIALPSADNLVASAAFINVYVSDGGDFVGDVLLDQFPLSSAGQRALYRELVLLESQPPDVNTSVGGASLIDPDRELLDWHWKRPVAGSGALGSGALGDVRLIESSGDLYAVLISPSAAVPEQWTRIASAGGGGGGGGMGASALLDVTDEDGPNVTDVGNLIFAASGSATVGVTDLGGGSAQVMIFASAAPGPPGAEGPVGPAGVAGHASAAMRATGSAQNIPATEEVSVSWIGTRYDSGRVAVLSSDEPGRIYIKQDGLYALQGHIRFGSASPTGGGERSTRFRKNGIGGGIAGMTNLASAGGPITQTISAIEPLASGDYIDLRAGVGSPVTLLVNATQFPDLVIARMGEGGSHTRRWASATVPALASGASANMEFGTAAGRRILEVRTNRQGRVRAYATPGDRSADVARAIGVDPTGDHGVLLDLRTEADLSWRLSPTVDAHNMEEPVANALSLNIQNLDGTGDFVVGFLHIPTEIV